ncbi:MAG: fasciclin domain-containing protein [Prevotella sp.]|nr:fasciclin domain-containing protein [Prevotella sp.]
MISIKNKYASRACFGIAAALAVTACSDFDDYNEAPVDALASSNQTLWENITQNSQLSDFAQLVKQSGFDNELSTPRSLTVWAPVNGSFSAADFSGLSKEDLLKQFVLNHVAEYTHVATGNVDERVHMMNEKSYDFTGNGSYTFDNVAISQTNLPNSNGMLHLLSGTAKFYPNLYEYISMAKDIDSLYNYFKMYELTTLDQNASVKGPMVNGAQTYIDSVMVTSNSLSRALNAQLESEDSSYTFIMPTNKAYAAMYNRVKPYYKFITKTVVPDAENFTSGTDTKTKSITVDAEYMSDSLTRRAIVNNLVFNNNDIYNKWVVDKGQYTDTLRSTLREKFSNPRDILEKYAVGEPVLMSNGYARIVDSLAYLPWEHYCYEIEANPRNCLQSLFPPTAQANRGQSLPDSIVERIFGPNSGITNYRYMWISPGGDRAKPDFFIELPNVMSTTYNFYVVFLPSAWPEVANDSRPNWLNFQLRYCNESGAIANYNFSKEVADSLLSGGELPKAPASVGAKTAFTNDPEKMDTVFIGQFTFPVGYRGLGDGYSPNIRVTSPISVFNKTQLETYTRDVRIAAILLRPVELDEYEAKNK